MGRSRKFSLFLNFIFLLILFLLSLYIAFRFTEPFFTYLFDNSKRVEKTSVISELQECITKYYEYIYYGQFEKAKHCTAIISRKETSDYEKKKSEIEKSGEFEVIVKYAYRLYGDTYRCYILLHDIKSDDYSYIAENDKEKMTQIVISLDRITDNFTIVTDSTFDKKYKEEEHNV